MSLNWRNKHEYLAMNGVFVSCPLLPFDARACTPLPDRATRRALFAKLTRDSGGGEFPREFQLTELVAASEDYSAGAIEEAVRETLSGRFLQKARDDPDGGAQVRTIRTNSQVPAGGKACDGPGAGGDLDSRDRGEWIPSRSPSR